MTLFPSPTSTWHQETYPTLSPNRPELSARGKNVLVTGGGTGIGAETARYFAMACASRIAILGRREQPLLDTKASIEKEFPNVKVFAASTDVTNKAQVDKAFADFAGDEKIHVVVSNAAVMGPKSSVLDVDSDKFLDGIQTNLKGALIVAQAFLRHASPDAVAIDVNSAAAHLTMLPGFASYNTSKLAVYRLWDSVANEHPKLSVYHIQPGVVETAMNKEAGGAAAINYSDDGESYQNPAVRNTRVLIVDIVSLPASYNVWLASPEAKFVRNKFLWANWDVDELKAKEKELDTQWLNFGLVGWPFGHTG